MSMLRSGISKIAPYVTRHWRTKIVSLILAAAVFYSIRSMISDQRTFIVPVEMVSTLMATDVTSVAAIPAEVRVTLRGPRAQLHEIRPEELKALATPRVRSTGVGLHDASVHLAKPGKELKLRVLQIEPSEVKVKFDTLGNVTLDVECPQLKGIPLAGEATVEWPKTPQVVVRGALTPLKELQRHSVKLQTEEIAVEGLTQSFTKRVKVMLPKDIGPVQVTPEDIEVKVTIAVE